MIYIFNFCSKFVLGRKSPFSFELHSSGRGKDERQVLFYCASGHGSGHQRGFLGGHDLGDRLKFGIPDRSPAQLRSYPNSCSVILAERWGSAPRLPAVHPAASRKD